MFRVEVLDQHGTVVRTVLRAHHPADSTMAYWHAIRSEPTVHVRVVEGDELPGMPENVIAQRFGNPCDAPCCVPLAAPWPEQNPVPSLGTDRIERERK